MTKSKEKRGRCNEALCLKPRQVVAGTLVMTVLLRARTEIWLFVQRVRFTFLDFILSGPALAVDTQTWTLHRWDGSPVKL